MTKLILSFLVTVHQSSFCLLPQHFCSASAINTNRGTPLGGRQPAPELYTLRAVAFDRSRGGSAQSCIPSIVLGRGQTCRLIGLLLAPGHMIFVLICMCRFWHEEDTFIRSTFVLCGSIYLSVIKINTVSRVSFIEYRILRYQSDIQLRG